MIVPGGGFSLDGKRWIACRPQLLPPSAGSLSAVPAAVPGAARRRARRRRTAVLRQACQASPMPKPSPTFLAPLRNMRWVVYRKRPFGGPKEVLRYLARYTHRVAISNRRLIACDDTGVTFKYKDYRLEGPAPLQDDDARTRRVHPPLPDARAARRLPPHPLLRSARQQPPGREHRARPRDCSRLPLLPIDGHQRPPAAMPPNRKHQSIPAHVAAARMIIIETFQRGCSPRYRPTASVPAIRIDTS